MISVRVIFECRVPAGGKFHLQIKDEFGDRLEPDAVLLVLEWANQLPDLTSAGLMLTRIHGTVSCLENDEPASRERTQSVADQLTRQRHLIELAVPTGSGTPIWSENSNRVGSSCWFTRRGSAGPSAWLRGYLRAWTHTAEGDGGGHQSWPAAIIEEARSGRVMVADAESIQFCAEEPSE